MRIVYLDESGTSSRQQEPSVYVGGVIVHGDHQLNKLRVALGNIMTRHIPETDRDNLVLHATDIYGGNKYFDEARKPEWTYEKRMAILNDLAQLPAALNLRVTFSRVQKEKFPKDKIPVRDEAELLVKCVGIAYMSCMIEVDQWFRQNARRENCFVVVEDNNSTRQFIKQAHQEHQRERVREGLSAREQHYFPLRHIQEDPNFQEKRVAHPLVLADFIAYFVKRRFSGDSRSFQFSDPWIGRTAALQVKPLPKVVQAPGG